MQWQPLESRAIEAVRYDEPSRALDVRFRTGRTYRYADVPPELYAWLLRVPDKGAFFNRMVREGYAYVETGGDAEPVQDLERALRDSLRPRER